MERPTGSGQVIGGWVLASVGVLMLIVGIFKDARGYDSVDVWALASKWMLIYFGGAALGLAAMLIIAGWIIHAISFLPGRDDAVFTTSQPPLTLTNSSKRESVGNDPDYDHGPSIKIIVGVFVMLGAFTILAILLSR